jgi:hypothetical protein
MRGDYELLSQNDLNRCVEAFVSARDTARQVLSAEISILREKANDAKEAAEQTLEPAGLFSKK